MNKVCTKCGESKALKEYYKEVRVKDGKTSECKSCTIARQKKYNKSDKGKLANAKAVTKYCKTGKGKLTHAKYQRSGKGKAANAKYFKSDKGRLANAKYMRTDKGKATASRAYHNKMIKISNTLCTLTTEEFNYILFLQNYRCIGGCGKTFNKNLKPTRDHIIPVELGGNFTKETIQALCQSCNSKKSIKYIDYRTDYHKEMIGQNFGLIR